MNVTQIVVAVGLLHALGACGGFERNFLGAANDAAAEDVVTADIRPLDVSSADAPSDALADGAADDAPSIDVRADDTADIRETDPPTDHRSADGSSDVPDVDVAADITVDVGRDDVASDVHDAGVDPPDDAAVDAIADSSGDAAEDAVDGGWARQMLTVVLAGSGSGMVTSSPAGVECGTTCSTSFPHGTSVVLSADAGANAFVGWSGACTGQIGCTVAMTTAQSVTATFAVPRACTTVDTASTCTQGTAAQIDLGQLTYLACHDRCQVQLAAASISPGCWILATNGNCYCRSGVLNTGGTNWGGSCN
jgi:hypothetical protein